MKPIIPAQQPLAKDPYHVEQERRLPRLQLDIPPSVVVFTLAFAVLLGAQFLVYRQRPAASPAPVDAVAAIEADRKFFSQYEFKDVYLDRNGGVEVLEGLRSMRATGRVRTAGSEQEVVLLRQYPDKGKFIYRTSETSRLSFTVGDESVWMTVEGGGVGCVQHRLEDDATQQLRTMASFYSPLMRWALDGVGEVLEFDTAAELNGRPVVRLKLQFPESVNPAVFFVDPANLQTVARHDLGPTGIVIKEQLYEDIRAVDQTQQPFRVVTRQDNQPDSIFEFSSIEFNVPILSSVFSFEDHNRPEGIAVAREGFMTFLATTETAAM